MTDDGKLYLWGDGSAGQLGMGTSSVLPLYGVILVLSLKQRAKPKQLKLKGVKRVLSVDCGYYHTAVITGESTLTPSH